MGACCGRPRPPPLTDVTKAKLQEFFDKVDSDKDKVISKEEAIRFWGSKFAKVNAETFFQEVDQNMNERITLEEFIAFFEQVKASGYYEEAEILEEIQSMEKGEAWLTWQKKDEARTSTGSRKGSKSSNGEAGQAGVVYPDGVRISRRDSKS
mmetsp:Transcript_40701/g.86624  ORF Transcript_40701/g.86624 Transcript_40701/m.86624 type:complete len:152 (+) Transcript_40701:92-547(+)